METPPQSPPREQIGRRRGRGRDVRVDREVRRRMGNILNDPYRTPSPQRQRNLPIRPELLQMEQMEWGDEQFEFENRERLDRERAEMMREERNQYENALRAEITEQVEAEMEEMRRREPAFFTGALSLNRTPMNRDVIREILSYLPRNY